MKYDPLLGRMRSSDDEKFRGYFDNEAAIIAAFPAGHAGWGAFNYDTDTMWYWDSETSAWVDSDRKGPVTSVNGQTGAVVISVDGFSSDFTSSDSTGFSWSSNVLTVTHNQGKLTPVVVVKNNDENLVSYAVTPASANALTINFPVAQVPISGTWSIKVN
jgi:hypothetical protein